MAIQPTYSKTTSQVSNTSPTILRPIKSESDSTKLVYSLLVNRVRPFLTARRGRWFYQNLSLTPPLIESALAGEMPLGLVTTSGTGEARWYCLDADDEGSSFELGLLAKYLAEQGSYSLYEPSRRGGHLYVFHRPISWQSSRAYGELLLREAGIENVEVYPKTGELNAVRMPGTRHPKDGKIYLPTNPVSGEELPLAVALSQITPLSLPEIEMEQEAAVNRSGKANSSEEFDLLVEALSVLTNITVYAPNKGKALCPWHPDENPSLLIKGGRFHCARPDCVWGDRHDVERYLRFGVLPPHH